MPISFSHKILKDPQLLKEIKDQNEKISQLEEKISILKGRNAYLEHERVRGGENYNSLYRICRVYENSTEYADIIVELLLDYLSSEPYDSETTFMEMKAKAIEEGDSINEKIWNKAFQKFNELIDKIEKEKSNSVIIDSNQVAEVETG